MCQKFSIAKPLLAAAAAVLVLGAATARAADDIQVNEQAPGRYTVQKGDTLWGIAGKFLKQPWRWPDIWRMNRDQIRNPHWIYPGDVIVLDKVDGQWRLTLDRPTVWLEPSTRVARLDAEAIPSIPPADLAPYITRPLVTGPDGLANAAEIVAGRDQRVVRGEGDVVYVAGMDAAGGDIWYIYRPGRTFVSPVDGTWLGQEQRFLGTVKVERFAPVSTVRITSANEEIFVGDRLLPAPREQLVNYIPHAPSAPIAGRIIATSRDSIEVGRGWPVTIDKGRADGVDVGAVLAIYRTVPLIADPRPSKEPDLIKRFSEPTIFYQPDRFLEVPPERTGLMFVYLVFDRVSYALVLNTTDPVDVGDAVRNP
jgi:hypothetical protein